MIARSITCDEAHLGLATTDDLLAEVAARMRNTQNSLKGRELGDLCEEARENLDPGVLKYYTLQYREGNP